MGITPMLRRQERSSEKCAQTCTIRNSTDGVYLVVMNMVESSLVSEGKEKQDQDPIFLELKANMHKKKK